jgi:hypothetical protein
MTAKKQSQGTGKPKVPPQKPKTPTPPPEVKVYPPTPKEEIPRGKHQCMFCANLQPLLRGDNSTSKLQGECIVHKKIVWKVNSCDQFSLKP